MPPYFDRPARPGGIGSTTPNRPGPSPPRPSPSRTPPGGGGGPTYLGPPTTVESPGGPPSTGGGQSYIPGPAGTPTTNPGNVPGFPGGPGPFPNQAPRSNRNRPDPDPNRQRGGGGGGRAPLYGAGWSPGQGASPLPFMLAGEGGGPGGIPDWWATPQAGKPLMQQEWWQQRHYQRALQRQRMAQALRGRTQPQGGSVPPGGGGGGPGPQPNPPSSGFGGGPDPDPGTFQPTPPQYGPPSGWIPQGDNAGLQGDEWWMVGGQPPGVPPVSSITPSSAIEPYNPNYVPPQPQQQQTALQQALLKMILGGG